MLKLQRSGDAVDRMWSRYTGDPYPPADGGHTNFLGPICVISPPQSAQPWLARLKKLAEYADRIDSLVTRINQVIDLAGKSKEYAGVYDFNSKVHEYLERVKKAREHAEKLQALLEHVATPSLESFDASLAQLGHEISDAESYQAKLTGSEAHFSTSSGRFHFGNATPDHQDQIVSISGSSLTVTVTIPAATGPDPTYGHYVQNAETLKYIAKIADIKADKPFQTSDKVGAIWQVGITCVSTITCITVQSKWAEGEQVSSQGNSGIWFRNQAEAEAFASTINSAH